MRRIFVVVVVLAVVVGGIWGFSSYRAQQNTLTMLEGLQTEEVNLGSLVATVGGTGVVRANQQASLFWETSGRVEEVNVRVGDEVEADEVLAVLADGSLPQSVILAQADLVSAQDALENLFEAHSELAMAQAAQAVANAEDALDLAERRYRNLSTPAAQYYIDQAYADLVLAEDKLGRAQDEFERWENKPQDNVIRAAALSNLAAAEQVYDAALRNYNNLKGTANAITLSVAEADLEVARVNLSEAQSEYERLLAGPAADDIAAAEARVTAAQATLDMAWVEAPFSGTITQAFPKAGDLVSPNTVAFRLDDLSRMLVDVEISEVDINRVAVGQEVVLTFDAILAKEYHGRVSEVALVGNLEQGVVNFKVTVGLMDPDQEVKPGMTAAVNIVVSQLEEVLLVPNRAVRVVDGKRVVYVLGEGGFPEAIEIVLGASSDTHSEVIESELAVGEVVVLNPPTVFESDGPPPFVGR